MKGKSKSANTADVYECISHILKSLNLSIASKEDTLDKKQFEKNHSKLDVDDFN